MVMTSQQQSTVTRLENKGFEYVYATGDLVLVEKEVKLSTLKQMEHISQNN